MCQALKDLSTVLAPSQLLLHFTTFAPVLHKRKLRLRGWMLMQGQLAGE